MDDEHIDFPQWRELDSRWHSTCCNSLTDAVFFSGAAQTRPANGAGSMLNVAVNSPASTPLLQEKDAAHAHVNRVARQWANHWKQQLPGAKWQ